MNEKQRKIEKLTNRILINFGIGILAYIILWILLSKLYMAYTPVLIVTGIFAIAAIVFYILSKKKGLPLKNYAHMFVAFAITLLLTQSSFIVASFIGVGKFSSIVKSSEFLKILFNRTYEVKFIAILGGIYLLAMLIYNIAEICKVSKEKATKKK